MRCAWFSVSSTRTPEPANSFYAIPATPCKHLVARKEQLGGGWRRSHGPSQTELALNVQLLRHHSDGFPLPAQEAYRNRERRTPCCTVQYSISSDRSAVRNTFCHLTRGSDG